LTPTTVAALAGHALAYRYSEGASPTVVFLGGFRSDMGGEKARYIESVAQRAGNATLCLDYSGHGLSGGEFEKGCVSDWAEDARIVIDAVAPGAVLIVGSSMGGWIMGLLATRFADRLVGAIGIASAPDFAADLLPAKLTSEALGEIERDGVTYIESAYGDGPYPITAHLLADGARCAVLDSKIEVKCPVRLIHGLDDPDVPWMRSVEFAGAFAGGDVRVELVKGGGHRLSQPAELARIGTLLRELLEPLKIAARGDTDAGKLKLETQTERTDV
jgi:pimeloyl-ACP methyl ester carboxylesterase